MHVPEMFFVTDCLQITCEFVYYTLLLDKGRLFFCDSQMISDLFACEQ